MAEVHIFTDGPIQSDYPEQIAEQLTRVGSADRIIHHLSSPGGNVYAGYKGYHKLVELGLPIDTIVEGEAQSMGSFLMLASKATGGKIKVLNPSRIMIHNPKFNVEGFGQNGYADSDALQGGADELRSIEDEMANVYAAAMSKKKATTVEMVKAMMKKETYMTAREAVELGLADEVINRIDIAENQKLKAVALGLEIKEVQTKTQQKMANEGEDKGLIAQVGDMIVKLGNTLKGSSEKVAQAVDMPIKGGGQLNVQGDVATVGSAATVDGAPADGMYEMEDGSVIKCVGGVIAEITPPAAAAAPSVTPQPDPAKMAQENEQLKQQLAALQMEAAKTKEQVTAKESEVAKVAEAIAKLEGELKTMKSKTVGADEKPGKAMEFKTAPVAYNRGTSDEAMKIKATRTVLADNLPWLERHYPGGKYPDGTRFDDYRSGGPEAVSILETNLNYTWNGVLATELFFKPTLSTPAIADVFNVDLGSTDKKRYHIAPVMSKVLKPYTGCDQAVTGSQYDITSKYIQLKPFQMYEGWCKDDFTNQLTGSYNVLAQEWLKTGNASFDPAGTPIDRAIVDGLKDAMRRDIWRRISFGDSTSSNADYNQIDGLWQSLIDQSGASNYCVYASKTNFGTGTLSASAAYNELLAIYKNSSNLLKEQAIDGRKGRFLVTRSVWENLYDSYTATGAVTELAFKQAMDGIPGQLTFRGIPVIPITIWDDFLADANNPLSATTRHLIAFTIKDNHVLGVENNSDLDKIDSWFEKKDNKRYYRSNMVLGFLGAIHCDLTTISY